MCQRYDSIGQWVHSKQVIKSMSTAFLTLNLEQPVCDPYCSRSAFSISAVINYPIKQPLWCQGGCGEYYISSYLVTCSACFLHVLILKAFPSQPAAVCPQICLSPAGRESSMQRSNGECHRAAPAITQAGFACVWTGALSKEELANMPLSCSTDSRASQSSRTTPTPSDCQWGKTGENMSKFDMTQSFRDMSTDIISNRPLSVRMCNSNQCGSCSVSSAVKFTGGWGSAQCYPWGEFYLWMSCSFKILYQHVTKDFLWRVMMSGGFTLLFMITLTQCGLKLLWKN